MKLTSNAYDLLSVVIALIAAMEFGADFGMFLLLVGIFLRLGRIGGALESSNEARP